MQTKPAASEMQERKDPRFIQFGDGETVEGVLIGVERVAVSGKSVTRFTVREDDSELVSFLGTYQINTKLKPSDVGHYVQVRCEGEDKSIKKGDNCMKLFKVAVSKGRVANAPLVDPNITDDDIPF